MLVHDICSVITDLTAGWRLQKIHAAKQCGLTGTGWSYNAGNILWFYREINIF